MEETNIDKLKKELKQKYIGDFCVFTSRWDSDLSAKCFTYREDAEKEHRRILNSPKFDINKKVWIELLL